MTSYYAHSENSRGEKHKLIYHLRRTAQLAETFACRDDYKSFFSIAGLLHDIGKYQPEFQTYLESGGKRGSVPHASWGAGHARILRKNEASVAIDGHHKGLPDRAEWQSDTERFYRKEVDGFDDVVETFTSEIKSIGESINALDSLTFESLSQREIFIRYLFSALTDSDWLSTEEHFDETKSVMRSSCVLDTEAMIDKLDREIALKSKEGQVNELRNQTREQVLRKATMPYGFYSLALPTGMGKTLTSVAWALRHADVNSLKRIIIVLPYINIIDQTAQILKGIFGEERVLEHHSGYDEEEYDVGDTKDYSITQQRKKLACENWDYPIIVTTSVQFFESLFSNKPSRCRKLHNIAESVVIFDEVQTLPEEVVLPTLQMLENVHDVMRVSFLFCTATQPSFEKRQGFDGISAIVPLVDNPRELYQKTRRIKYHLVNRLNPVDYSELLHEVMQSEGAALVVFNTKKTALGFYEHSCTKDTWERRYHLSTAMCPSHRKDVIARIRGDLEAHHKILVVSTQLIEAGVDFDFPTVFRAIAPLEAIIQAAGRCNREGRLPTQGNVFLFKLQDGGMPDKTYSACAGFTEDLIKSDIDLLHSHDSFSRYYEKIIDLFTEPDKYGIRQSRQEFRFRVVNDSYRIIQEATERIYIYNFSEESKRLFHSLEHKKFMSRDDYRKMQKFTVQIYGDFLAKNRDMCRSSPQGFWVWYGNYNSETGISVDPIEADKLVI